jgi:hypothetical protein
VLKLSASVGAQSLEKDPHLVSGCSLGVLLGVLLGILLGDLLGVLLGVLLEVSWRDERLRDSLVVGRDERICSSGWDSARSATFSARRADSGHEKRGWTSASYC